MIHVSQPKSLNTRTTLDEDTTVPVSAAQIHDAYLVWQDDVMDIIISSVEEAEKFAEAENQNFLIAKYK